MYDSRDGGDLGDSQYHRMATDAMVRDIVQGSALVPI